MEKAKYQKHGNKEGGRWYVITLKDGIPHKVDLKLGDYLHKCEQLIESQEKDLKALMTGKMAQIEAWQNKCESQEKEIERLKQIETTHNRADKLYDRLEVEPLKQRIKGLEGHILQLQEHQRNQ